MRSVRISLKAARVLLDYLNGAPRAVGSVAIAELERAMKPKRSVKLARARRETKAITKKALRASVRTEVMIRASARCENCGRIESEFNHLEMDHFWGRARAESVETCWALCNECHRWKTANNPSRQFWLMRFVGHCKNFGYEAQRKKAGTEWDVIESMKQGVGAGP